MLSVEDDQPQPSTSKTFVKNNENINDTDSNSMNSFETNKLFQSGSLKDVFVRISSNKDGGAKYNRIIQSLIFFICKDRRAFNIVEGEGFLRLMKELEPTFTVPSAKYLKKGLLKI
ncbi:unnamed protein product [Euphydryas editha]|uniref:Uncharacterized protein n=1 Tax=Euphydryas editha TaxID=104508 RepID=A0AAU9UDG6_EUPED|nr:unnamed protein product [Euphydryas editha]